MVMGELQAEFLRPGVAMLVGDAGLVAPKVKVLGPDDGGFPAPNAGAADPVAPGPAAPNVKGRAALAEAPPAVAADPNVNGVAGAPEDADAESFPAGTAPNVNGAATAAGFESVVAASVVGAAPNVNGAAAAAGFESVVAASVAGAAPNVNGAAAAAGFESVVAAPVAGAAPNVNGAAAAGFESVAAAPVAGAAPNVKGAATAAAGFESVAAASVAGAAPNVNGAAAAGFESVAAASVAGAAPNVNGAAAAAGGFESVAAAASPLIEAAPNENAGAAEVAVLLAASVAVPVVAAGEPKAGGAVLLEGLMPKVGVADAAAGASSEDAPKLNEGAVRFFWLGSPVPSALVSSGCSDSFGLAVGAVGVAASAPSVCGAGTGAAPKENPPPVAVDAGAPKLIGAALAAESFAGDFADESKETPPLLPPADGVEFAEGAGGFTASATVEVLPELPNANPPPVFSGAENDDAFSSGLSAAGAVGAPNENPPAPMLPLDAAESFGAPKENPPEPKLPPLPPVAAVSGALAFCAPLLPGRSASQATHLLCLSSFRERHTEHFQTPSSNFLNMLPHPFTAGLLLSPSPSSVLYFLPLSAFAVKLLPFPLPLCPTSLPLCFLPSPPESGASFGVPASAFLAGGERIPVAGTDTPGGEKANLGAAPAALFLGVASKASGAANVNSAPETATSSSADGFALGDGRALRAGAGLCITGEAKVACFGHCGLGAGNGVNDCACCCVRACGGLWD